MDFAWFIDIFVLRYGGWYDEKVETATGVSNFIYLILAILGGLWMPMDILPKILQNIGNWLPGFHYGNGAWEIIRGDLPEIKIFLYYRSTRYFYAIINIYKEKTRDHIIVGDISC